ncbi:hypothetical protein [Microtetraspora malaysiensis]|uniref:hypothetical protein n=1 Tax=Microtetraspora malaysiensis TaxID=161358 RepID=UPI003D8DF9EF
MTLHRPEPAKLPDGFADGDLDNLGPTCQFHNRDRYRNPAHYQLHRTGKNRWGFTYLGSRTGTRQ